MIKRIAKPAKFAVPLIVAFFVGRAIHANWQDVREAQWAIRPGYLAASLALSSFWFLIRPYGWNVLLNAFGRSVPYSAVFRVFRQAELSRYVPGAVWQFLSRIYLIKAWGVTASACLAATMVDMVLATLASVIPALWVLPEALPEFGRPQRIMLFAFPAVSLAIVHPVIFNAWAGFLARRMGQSWTKLEIRWLSLLGVWGLYIAAWLLLVAGVAAFVHGVLTFPDGRSTYIASSYAAAWLAGSVMMIAPAGMGIREGALGILLSQVMPTGAAFTLAVAIRFWLALVEIVWVALGSFFPRHAPPSADL